MAGSPVNGPTRCPACGVKVKRGRAKCPRCRAIMPEAPTVVDSQAEAEHAPDRRLSIALSAAGLLAAGFAIAMLTRTSTVRAAAGASPATATTAASPASPAAPASAEALRPMDGTRDPRNASQAGVMSYQNGDVAGAVATFTKVVEANPMDASALNNLGQALVRAKRASDAIEYFDRAIEQSPDVWAYHFNRGRAYAELGSWPQAIGNYRQAAGIFPGDYATQFNLALALQASGDVSGAIEAYEAAVQLAPGQPDFLLSLAAAQESAQRPADAAATYRKYLELEPGSAEADKIKERIARLTS